MEPKSLFTHNYYYCISEYVKESTKLDDIEFISERDFLARNHEYAAIRVKLPIKHANSTTLGDLGYQIVVKSHIKLSTLSYDFKPKNDSDYVIGRRLNDLLLDTHHILSKNGWLRDDGASLTW